MFSLIVHTHTHEHTHTPLLPTLFNSITNNLHENILILRCNLFLVVPEKKTATNCWLMYLTWLIYILIKWYKFNRNFYSRRLCRRTENSYLSNILMGPRSIHLWYRFNFKFSIGPHTVRMLIFIGDMQKIMCGRGKDRSIQENRVFMLDAMNNHINESASSLAIITYSWLGLYEWYCPLCHLRIQLLLSLLFLL